MTNEEIWEHFENLEDEIDKDCKDVDMDKVYDEICKKHGITREQWDKMEEWEKISLVAPNGIWQYDEDEVEEDSMDKADSWYDEQQDRLASVSCK